MAIWSNLQQISIIWLGHCKIFGLLEDYRMLLIHLCWFNVLPPETYIFDIESFDENTLQVMELEYLQTYSQFPYVLSREVYI